MHDTGVYQDTGCTAHTKDDDETTDRDEQQRLNDDASATQRQFYCEPRYKVD